MQRPHEDKFNRALDLWHQGQHSEALRILSALAEEHPDNPAIRGTLGGCLHDLDRNDDALPHAAAAVRIAPRSELASITLFHILYALQREAEAWEEAQRFMALASSEEYDLLLADLRAGAH